MKRALLVLTLAAVVPGCGGGGGGGGGSGAAVPPNAGPAPTALAPVDTSTPDVVVNTAQSNAAIINDLQAALTAGGIITFDNVAPITITLTAELYVPVLTTVVLDGKNLVTISGGLTTRILEKDWKAVVTVQRLAFVDGRTATVGAAIWETSWDGALTVIDCTFTNCKTTTTGPDIGGGAIRVNGQTHLQVSGCTFTDCDGSNGGAIDCIGSRITIVNCTFTQCDAFGTGGGAEVGPTGQGGIGGAVYVDGVHQNGSLPRLDIANCTFTNNSANHDAGAVSGYTYPGTGSSVLVDTCTFTGNSAKPGGHGFAGALYHQENSLTVRNSTFSGNTAAKVGGGLWSLASNALIENCTFSGNAATASPGFGGAMNVSGAFWIRSCTIANNTAGGWGGGIWTGTGGSVTLMNTILQDNTGTDPWNGWNTNAALVDGGSNLQWPTTRGGGQPDTPATTAIVWADAQLGALASNGGPTQTRSIPAASPAENTGTSSAPSVDQRGMPRVGAADIGAFERQ